MNKLSNTANSSDVRRAVREIRNIVREHGWERLSVAPYGHAINILTFLAQFDDFDRCTEDSKEILILELNGAIEYAINPWLEQDAQPKVTVRLTFGDHAGEIKVVTRDFAQIMIEANLAEEVLEVVL